MYRVLPGTEHLRLALVAGQNPDGSEKDRAKNEGTGTIPVLLLDKWAVDAY